MRVEIPNQITVTIGGLISRGVKAVEVTDAGRLVFTLTDGSTVDLGSVIGPEGPKGETGPAGPQGQTGPAGAQGEQGPKGDTGAEGPKGATGDTGPKGEPGEKGEKGDKGDTGATGPKGETGPQGQTGPQGPAGPTGPKGDMGTGFTVKGYYGSVSALQASVENPEVGDAYGVGAAAPYDIYIYDGVTNAWVNNGPLQGAKGDKGDPGEQGPKGEPGDTGPAGASGADGVTPTIGENGNWYLGATDTGKPSRGEKGDTGATGAEGPAGKTPVKGTDYFTEADKQEIASAAAGLVDLSGKQDKIKTSGILKGDGEGGVSTAVPGTDYLGVDDEIQGLRLRGGINSIINNVGAVSINPAVNAVGFLRYNGGNVQIFYDGILMPFQNWEIDTLFDGKSGTNLNFGKGPSKAQTACLWSETTNYPQNARVMYQTTSGVFRWYKALKESKGVTPEGDSTGAWEDASSSRSPSMMDVRNLEVSIVIDSNLVLKWENGASFYWRAAKQNCRYYKIEIYDSITNQYVLVAERDNIPIDEVVNTQYMGASVDGVGKRVRITFRAQSNEDTGWFAVTQIAFTGIIGGIEGTLVNRGGSTMYGNLSPYTSGGASLGTSLARWNEVHANKFYGDGSNLTNLPIDALPAVTTADNGKYLRVIDGVWDAGELDFFICAVTASGSSYTCDKTSAQILAAARAGKIPIAVYNNAVYFLAGGSQMFAKFTRISSSTSEVLTVTAAGAASFQTVTLQTVPSSTSIDAPNRVNLGDNVEYYLTNVGTVTFAFPAGTKFECWLRITTAASGTITVTFPATVKYIGEAPAFGAGETWELSIKDGVVIAVKEAS